MSIRIAAIMACAGLMFGSVSEPARGQDETNAQAATELAEQLSSGDLEKQRDAAYALAKLGVDSKPALGALVKALESERDSQVWFQVATANCPNRPGRQGCH